MAHGQRCTVVQFIKYLQKLWLVTGMVLGGRTQRHASGESVGHTRALGQLLLNCRASLLLLGVTFYHFLACFLPFGLPTVPSSQLCLQESLSL